MLKLRMGSLLAIALVSVSLSAPAAHAMPGISMMQFQGNGYAATQTGGGNVFTGQASWNPTMNLGVIDVRGNVGAALMKNGFDSKFVSFNYQVLANYSIFSSLSVEAGGGLQTWMSNGGTHPIFSGNAVWGFPTKLFGYFNRIFAGYSKFLLTGNSTDEFRLGVGVAL